MKEATDQSTDERIELSVSTGQSDEEWDRFLDTSPLGHHEQTSMWAAAKATDGWSAIRVVARSRGSVVAGFQMLYRPLPSAGRLLGNAAYVSKGPVVPADREDALRPVMSALLDQVRRLRVRALIVQPPDRDNLVSTTFPRFGFAPNRLSRFTDATIMVDLDGSQAALFARMEGRKRTNVRRALKAGVIVREGDDRDIGTFFRFMLETCRRQKVPPHPSREEFVRAAWKAFIPTRQMRLYIAEAGGKPVSAIVAFGIARCLSLWKFGWSGEHAQDRPNDYLFWEIIRRAQDEGFRFVDIIGIDREAGAPGGEKVVPRGSHRQGHDRRGITLFKLGFGGKIVALPASGLYIPNRLLRCCYRVWAGGWR